MNEETSKEKEPTPRVDIKETTSDQVVIPIYNGKVQPSRTFEKYVEDLSEDQPTNWSKI